MAEHDHRALAPVTAIALGENRLGPAKILAGMVSDAVGLARATKSPLPNELGHSNLLKKKVGDLPLSDIQMRDGIALAISHIESGVRTFSAFAKVMVSDLGDGVRPYLKSWYVGIKFDPAAVGFFGMDHETDVAAFDVESVQPDRIQHVGPSTVTDDNALYQHARLIYDNLTDNGGTTWVGDHSRFGLPQSSLEVAFRVFKDLAERGYGKAYYPLSTLYGGMQSVEGDAHHQKKFMAMALEWCQEHCDENDAEIWNDLGHLYLHEDYEECYYWWTKAADAEHPWGLWNLMGMYENGCGACEQDYDEALQLQIRAAEVGNLPAIHGLIHQYDFGGSPIQDDMLAKHWRQRARDCESALHESLAQDLEGLR